MQAGCSQPAVTTQVSSNMGRAVDKRPAAISVVRPGPEQAVSVRADLNLRETEQEHLQAKHWNILLDNIPFRKLMADTQLSESCSESHDKKHNASKRWCEKPVRNLGCSLPTEISMQLLAPAHW